MDDAWDSQMMMGVGMGDLRGMQQQQPSCSRQELHQEMGMTSASEQELQHHQEADYFGNHQVSGGLYGGGGGDGALVQQVEKGGMKNTHQRFRGN